MSSHDERYNFAEHTQNKSELQNGEKNEKVVQKLGGEEKGVVTDAAKTQKISSMFPVGPAWPPGRAAVMFQNFNNIHILFWLIN